MPIAEAMPGSPESSRRKEIGCVRYARYARHRLTRQGREPSLRVHATGVDMPIIDAVRQTLEAVGLRDCEVIEGVA